MKKSEKIYAVALFIVILLVAITTIVSPVVKGICTGDWSSLILWVFVPGLAVFACAIYYVEFRRSSKDD